MLGASVVVFVTGFVTVLWRPAPHVGPATCAKRVARALHFEVLSQPVVSTANGEWVATVPSERAVLRVTGVGHTVSGVQALTGPGADLLQRPQRLVGLAVRC